MLSVKFTLACVGALTFCCAYGGLAATRPESANPPAAVATNADVNYCFARVRGLDPGRLPPAYLVLQLRVRVSYRNAGTRPLVLPLERVRTVYSGFSPAAMSVFHEGLDLVGQGFKVMKYLPADVGPDNPVDPKNDVFTVIPAGGEMTPALIEDIALPVNRTALFRHYPDLRGHKVFIKLQFAHRELSTALAAELSDRWSRFGVPWTGTLTTNTFEVDVPAQPQAVACKDNYSTVR
jgi:hypothetical protein